MVFNTMKLEDTSKRMNIFKSQTVGSCNVKRLGRRGRTSKGHQEESVNEIGEKKGEYGILEPNERSCSESDRLGQMRLID